MLFLSLLHICLSVCLFVVVIVVLSFSVYL